ncbi:hypothetical protein PFISCL1PPCAC_6145 [Pristionchus fissidentatus]|uniref:GP-PDE domain-containing protein n=1 Tax=Pristionchus fissidentatus TaxID=1538716 RepID=A0AAV5V9G4_9BILA|nr:hypothetical protein PFISCL1PPCAC_6145 [Pristionchus fissidentatus]
MASTRVHFTVDVDRELNPTESVFVTGSSSSLGEWDSELALPLHPHESIAGRWVGRVETGDEVLKFRYFIGYKLFGVVERSIVSVWESHRNSRHALIKAETRNGECRKNHIDIFDFYGGVRKVSEGWLQYDEENEIVLSIHGKALKFYKSERNNCKIKVTPLDVRRKSGLNGCASPSKDEEEEIDDDDETDLPLPSHSATLVSVLSSKSSNCKYASQPERGTIFRNLVDYLVFKTRSVAVDFLAFFLEIFSEEGKRVGSCYALPSTLQDTSGHTSIPFINSSGRPIGHISVEYLFIRNLRVPHSRQSMETTYGRHWKKRSTIEVGHRGAGNSYTKCAMARENTIHSLNVAAANGADYVEFDVQLTKDKIAVIYHDFHVLLSVAKRAKDGTAIEHSPTDFHEMALKDLTLKQLQLLKMDHVAHPVKKHEGVSTLTGEGEEESDFLPFPTLVETLQKVDPVECGFNIEVKFPMMQEDGLHECANYFERNNFVDIIVADVLNNAGQRRIMFSSFDPDICAMIAMKQNRYPVFFLCVGQTTRYARFSDQRCSTSLASVNFASGADLLGVNFNSEDLLLDPRPVRRASELGMISFVWGEDLDKKEHINYFKRDVGVDGIIYDRIGEDERRRNVFVVEREAKKALNLVTSGDSTPVRKISPERNGEKREKNATTLSPQFTPIKEHEEETIDSTEESSCHLQPQAIST